MLNPLIFDRRTASLLLKKGGVKAVVDYCYSIDSALYSHSKSKEGQYSYLQYVTKVRRIIHYAFETLLPGEKQALRSSLLKQDAELRKERSEASVIVLNNTSLLGHVSVLRSMAQALQGELGSSNLFIICLFAKGDYCQWNTRLSDSGFNVLQIDQSSIFSRLLETDHKLRPAQFIWWGWPPGQWLGPLVCPWALHRSVSFKYDIPSAEHFFSHHIGYGQSYAEMINDQTSIFGFHQPISVASISCLSSILLKDAVSARTANRLMRPLSQRKVIQIGALSREEKVEQPAFLSLLVQILKADRRLIFNWTGRAKSSLITSTLDQHGLSNRHQFHGWVRPVDFLPKLDIYLDTFPYGTGETFATAGYLGLPIATLASPYEAHFSNILTAELKEMLVRKSPADYGRWVLELASGSRQIPDPSLLQEYFLRCFDNAMMHDLPSQLVINGAKRNFY